MTKARSPRVAPAPAGSTAPALVLTNPQGPGATEDANRSLLRRRSGVVVSVALTVALSACGSAAPDTAEPADRASATRDDSPDVSAGGDELEQITPGAVAVVVREHLGPRAVRRFITFGPESEPGSVAVMIRLREGTRADNFAVTVSSPDQAAEFGQAGSCSAKGREDAFGDTQCRTLDNGTTVMTTEVAEGFSDDNTKGAVVFGTAVTPDAGAAMAMYESYDDTPAVRATDLDSILTDPRLTWLTEPALNDAGEDVDLKTFEG